MNQYFVLSTTFLGIAALAHAQGQPPAQTPPAPQAAPAAMASNGAAIANAPRPTKIGYIFLQQAVLQTSEGKKASDDLTAKYAPKRAELDKKQNEIVGLQDQLKKGSATMSEEARAKLEREIDAKTKALNRDTDDASADMEQEGNRVMGEIAGKMQAVVQQYAVQNGFAVILDTSSQQSQVFWAANSLNITNDAVKIYNDAHPLGATTQAKPPAPPKGPAASPAAPAKPPAAAPPATKKQ